MSSSKERSIAPNSRNGIQIPRPSSLPTAVRKALRCNRCMTMSQRHRRWLKIEKELSMKRIPLLAAVCLFASISAIAQQGSLTITRAKVLPKDGTVRQMNLPLFPLKKPAGKVFEQALATGGGSSARLHFKIDPQTDPEREPWSIVIRDSKNSKDLWTISS